MTFWKSLSIKQKIWGLVVIPATVLLILALGQVIEVNNQLTQIERTKATVGLLQRLSRLNENALSANALNALSPQQINEITSNISDIFSGDQQLEISAAFTQYVEAIDLVKSNTEIDALFDDVLWQLDAYQELLLKVEKNTHSNYSSAIGEHLQSLFQLKWMLFWAVKEARISSEIVLYSATEQTQIQTLTSELSALIQNQQLYVERFVTINANEQQVSMLLNAFSDDAFEHVAMYRDQLFNVNREHNHSFTLEQIAFGEQAFGRRLALFHEVADKISQQLINEASEETAKFRHERWVLFLMIFAVLAIVLALGIKLATRITRNLSHVLSYLENESQQVGSLSQQIDGKDELSRFARQVERLTVERRQQQADIVDAKNEALAAKESAIKASKAKSSFLANMSHEIRTPLNGVIGMSEVLAGTELTASQKDYVDTIETSSQLLLSLINDVLDFSKIESGKLSLSLHSTALRETCYDLAAIVGPKIKEKALGLSLKIDENLPSRVLADDHRIRQVLLNLLSNAVKFTQQGTISLKLSVLGQNKETVQLLFEVIDSGIGISPSQQEHIFQPFSQEDASITKQFAGTGLGLAISRQLVDLMDGEIGVESEKNNGSRFYFSISVPVVEEHHSIMKSDAVAEIILVCDHQATTQQITRELSYLDVSSVNSYDLIEKIPSDQLNASQILLFVATTSQISEDTLADFEQLRQKHIAVCLIKHFNSETIDAGNSIVSIVTYPLLGNRLVRALEACNRWLAQPHNSEANSKRQSLSEKKVLIVEDNAVNQKVLSVQLEKHGYFFDIADNGQQAVDKFTAGESYDLVLMDCMMPIKDGFAATREIRHYEQLNNKPETPIIALTASVLEEDIKKCFASGMNDYVPKPFKQDILFERIATAIAQKAANSKQEERSIDIKSSKNGEDEKKSTLKVLLVEDNKINQKVAILLLDKAGYKHQVANNGQEAIDIYKQDHGFDVILMDLMMPEKDGFTATREIRSYEQAEQLAPTPIIALTASVIDDDIQQCFECGMNAYIPKPVKSDKLYSEIKNLTSKVSEVN